MVDESSNSKDFYKNESGDPFSDSPTTHSGASVPPPVKNPHPQENTILIVGLLGFIVCQLAAPFAWYMGSKARKEIKASNGALDETTPLTVGYILGVVGSAFLGIMLFLAGILLTIVLVFADDAREIIRDGNFCVAQDSTGNTEFQSGIDCQGEFEKHKDDFLMEDTPR